MNHRLLAVVDLLSCLLLVSWLASTDARAQGCPADTLVGFVPREAGFDGRVGSLMLSCGPAGVSVARRSEPGSGEALVHRAVAESPVTWEGGDPLPGVINVFIGSDPASWRSRLPHFREIVGHEASGKVFARLWIDAGKLRLDGDPRVLDLVAGLQQEGAAEPSISAQPPRGAGPVVSEAFEAGTYLNGDVQELVMDVIVAEDGDAIVLGAAGIGFPSTPGAYDPTYNGPFLSPFNNWADAFIGRLTPDMSSLEFATFLGSTHDDRPSSLHLTATGDIVVTGRTKVNFPTTPGAYQEVAHGNSLESFVTRLTPEGDALVFSTYFGGSESEQSEHGVLLSNEDVILVGHTNSADLPVTSGAYDTTFSAETDTFVTRLSSDGSALEWCTYLGGDAQGGVFDVAAAPDDTIILFGAAGGKDNDFPFTPGAYSEFGALFVARMSSDGAKLLASTALGDVTDDGLGPRAVAVRPDNSVVVAGNAFGTNFPVTPSAYDPVFPGPFGTFVDGYVTCFTPELDDLVFSTAFGTGGLEQVWDVAVDSAGAITLAGSSWSFNFPTTLGAYSAPILTSLGDPFIARFSSDGRSLDYCTLIPGNDLDGLDAWRCALMPTNSTVVGMTASSTDLPTSDDAYATSYTSSGPPVGTSAVWVARFSTLPTGVGKYGESTPGSSGPLSVGAISGPFVGESAFGLTCSGAPAGSSRGLLVLSATGLLESHSVAGVQAWIDFGQVLGMLPVKSDALGGARVRLSIPADPAVAGFTAYAQFFWFEEQPTGLHVTASNAVRIIVQP